MSRIPDLGARIELVSMDRHAGDTTLGLYRRPGPDGPRFLVHTYSTRPEAAGRLQFLRAAMVGLGGMEACADAPHLLRFACGAGHELACRRLFLEAARLESGAAPEPRSLRVEDRKLGVRLAAVPLGHGRYRVRPDDAAAGPDAARRAQAVAAGLAKLAALDPVAGDGGAVAFPCGVDHHALVGLLLGRALNVRAALREHEEAASRGVLQAPGRPE
ncbi:MAG: hypothetical protein ABIL09_02920 [Gemmatimonadota bacterium]